MALQKLTPKQARFVHEYLIDLNATQAAIRAGYKEKNANNTASVMLANSKIQAAIQEQRDAMEKASLVTAEWVKRQIAEIAQNEDAKDQDRLKALDMLAKMLGLYDRREDSGDTVQYVYGEELEELAI